MFRILIVVFVLLITATSLAQMNTPFVSPAPLIRRVVPTHTRVYLFTTTNCVPCWQTKPEFDAIADRNKGLPGYEFDVIRDRAEAQAAGVFQFPTIIVFKNGREVGRHVGRADRFAITKFVRESVRK